MNYNAKHPFEWFMIKVCKLNLKKIALIKKSLQIFVKICLIFTVQLNKENELKKIYIFSYFDLER